MKQPSLIEQTGYSYSGVSALLRDHQYLTKAFLTEMCNEYQKQKKEIEELEATLRRKKTNFNSLLNVMNLTANVMIKDGKSKDQDMFTYMVKNQLVLIAPADPLPEIEIVEISYK